MLTEADFTNNAQDEAAIVQMFKTNIVMISYSPARNVAGVHGMHIVSGFNGNTNWIGRDWNGNLIDVHTVKNFTPVGNTFQSYWCPYESNDCKLAWLGSAADYMFTAKMDGCTFGVGSAAPSGERMVAHANMGGKGADQLDLIRGKVAFRRDLGLKTLAPSSYYFGSADTQNGPTWRIQATTFGLRLANGNWKFYCQAIKYDQTQKTMELVALVPVA